MAGEGGFAVDKPRMNPEADLRPRWPEPRKYLRTALLNWQDALAYRANAVIWMLTDTMPIFAVVLVWLAVYQPGQVIQGFTLERMVTYYLLASALGVVLTPYVEYRLNYEIRQGLLSQNLVKPMDYHLRLMVEEFSWLIMKGFASAPFFLVGAWLLRHHLALPHPSATQWAAFLLSLPLALTIQLGLKISLGSLAFWLGDASGVMNTYWALAGLLQGSVVPLALLPDWLRELSQWLPFRFILSWPVSLLQGTVSEAQVVQGLWTQAAWALGLLLLSRVVWHLGLRSYSAVGG